MSNSGHVLSIPSLMTNTVSHINGELDEKIIVNVKYQLFFTFA